MAAKKPKGNTVATFALELVGVDSMMRIFAEHEGQIFTISTLPVGIAKKLPERPIAPDCQFNFQECILIAAKYFTGDPSAADDKHARYKLAGMVIHLATLMGMTDLEIQQS